MSSLRVVVRSEFSSVLRSRWLYAFILLLVVSCFGFGSLSDDTRKTQLALINILVILVPLVTLLFSTTYWYNSEPYTQLLLSQPISRGSLFWARSFVMVTSLAICILLGVNVPCFFLDPSQGSFAMFLASLALILVFYFIGSLISTQVKDRMWGIGLCLGVWFFFAVVYDALLLLVLYWLREYPLEMLSSILCALNPLGLVRVNLLMYFDAPLLLGHSGAFIRKLVETGAGYIWSSVFLLSWILIPAILASRKFNKTDF